MKFETIGKLLALRELLLECGIGNNSNSLDEGESTNDVDGGNCLNQHRVLIFCQLKSMIDIIETELLTKMSNVTHLRLDGTLRSASTLSGNSTTTRVLIFCC